MRVHKVKKIYTFTAGILLIILYIVIFCFSAEDAEHSSRASVKVTEFLLRLYYGTASGSGEEAVAAEKALPTLCPWWKALSGSWRILRSICVWGFCLIVLWLYGSVLCGEAG